MPESFVFLDLASSESSRFQSFRGKHWMAANQIHRFHCSDGFLSNLSTATCIPSRCCRWPTPLSASFRPRARRSGHRRLADPLPATGGTPADDASERGPQEDNLTLDIAAGAVSSDTATELGERPDCRVCPAPLLMAVAQHHVMLDQPLAFVAALRMLLESWMHAEAA